MSYEEFMKIVESNHQNDERVLKLPKIKTPKEREAKKSKSLKKVNSNELIRL